MRLALEILLASATLLLPQALAHSWNEQLSLINKKGHFVGPYGYPRGYMARTDPGFNGYVMDWLLPTATSERTRINGSDPLCHPSQRTQNQTANYPRLKVAPGSGVAMKYLENGHVTLPQNQPGKPPKGGTVFVFGTTKPSNDELISDVLEWNQDGTGGDKRGRLLTAQNFDDGRCHQINTSPISEERQTTFPDPYPGQPGSKNELWCETDLILPSDPAIIPVGSLYTIYWVWQWPTQPGEPGLPDGKDEYYTTCSDVEVLAEEPKGPVSNTLVQQDPMSTAVSDWKSRTAITQVANVKYAEATSWAPTQWATAGVYTSSPAGQSSFSLVQPSSTYTQVTTTMSLPTSSPSPMKFTTITISSAQPPVHNAPIHQAPAHQTVDAAQQPLVLTALVTVTATLKPNESVLVVEGTHVVTFSADRAQATS